MTERDKDELIQLAHELYSEHYEVPHPIRYWLTGVKHDIEREDDDWLPIRETLIDAIDLGVMDHKTGVPKKTPEELLDALGLLNEH